MNEAPQKPQDNRPDVEVISTVLIHQDSELPFQERRVRYEARCRFGCGSYFTSDVAQVVNYTNGHVTTNSHFWAKMDRLQNDN